MKLVKVFVLKHPKLIELLSSIPNFREMPNRKITPDKFEFNNIPRKIILACPSCAFIPENSNLFLSLPVSNYNMGHKKLMIIKCPMGFCDYEGNILDWLQFN